MKLILSDFLYLGINVYDYEIEEITILKANLEVNDLVNELFDKKNYSSIEILDLDFRAYNLKIYHDIYKELCDIYRKLRFLESYSIYKFDNLEGHFKVILKALIELREKGIHQYDAFESVKECTIRNLKTLFFERYNREKYPFGVEVKDKSKEDNIIKTHKGHETEKPYDWREELKHLETNLNKLFKAHFGRETEKRKELEGFLKRYVELTSYYPEAYATCGTTEFYFRLKTLTEEYKKYEADNYERDKKLLV